MEVLEMLYVPVVTEPTIEEKRQVIQILGTIATLYREDDIEHDHLKIKYQPITPS
jgi:hypothetical protein